MKPLTGKQHPSGWSDQVRRAARLRDALVSRARESHHTPADVARILDMSTAHWYRIKKEPIRLARLPLERVSAIAAYVGWPRVQVMIAIGWLEPNDADRALSEEGVIQGALRRLQAGSVAGDLSTPLDRAAPDHQLLMARLLLLAEAGLTGAFTLVGPLSS